MVAAASEPNGLVTNGMSESRRDAQNANAALLVTLTPESFPDRSTLGGLVWQREIERRAFEAGGGDYRAPAQLVSDFLDGRKNKTQLSAGRNLVRFKYCTSGNNNRNSKEGYPGSGKTTCGL